MERQPIENPLLTRRLLLSLGAAWLTGSLAGCGCGPLCGRRRPGADAYARSKPVLGTISDDFWQKQVDNADASNFVIYQHEFAPNGVRLNTLGEDHIKQIAMRLSEGAPYPVIIERSTTSAKATTKHQYPIHVNPDLDNQRREVVVKALVAMEIKDAEDRVVVSKSYTNGITGDHAERAYERGYNQINSRGGGFGGGFGGFGGGGGLGGIGGGGFGGGGFF